MARDTGLNMDTDSEAETSTDDESDKLPHHQSLSPSSGGRECQEDEGPESDMWQTRSNSNVHVALPFAGLPLSVSIPNIATIPLLEMLKLFFFTNFLMILVLEISKYCHQYYAAMVMTTQLLNKSHCKKCSSFWKWAITRCHTERVLV
jgi:hypothetical protein